MQCTYYLCSVAPTGAPRELHFTNIQSKSVVVSFGAIECIHRNGYILGYVVEFQREGDQPMRSAAVDNATFSVNVTELAPFIPYTFIVRGRNNHGLGPPATVMAQTSEDSTCLIPQN